MWKATRTGGSERGLPRSVMDGQNLGVEGHEILWESGLWVHAQSWAATRQVWADCGRPDKRVALHVKAWRLTTNVWPPTKFRGSPWKIGSVWTPTTIRGRPEICVEGHVKAWQYFGWPCECVRVQRMAMKCCGHPYLWVGCHRVGVEECGREWRSYGR